MLNSVHWGGGQQSETGTTAVHSSSLEPPPCFSLKQVLHVCRGLQHHLYCLPRGPCPTWAPSMGFCLGAHQTLPLLLSNRLFPRCRSTSVFEVKVEVFLPQTIAWSPSIPFPLACLLIGMLVHTIPAPFTHYTLGFSPSVPLGIHPLVSHHQLPSSWFSIFHCPPVLDLPLDPPFYILDPRIFVFSCPPHGLTSPSADAAAAPHLDFPTFYPPPCLAPGLPLDFYVDPYVPPPSLPGAGLLPQLSIPPH